MSMKRFSALALVFSGLFSVALAEPVQTTDLHVVNASTDASVTFKGQSIAPGTGNYGGVTDKEDVTVCANDECHTLTVQDLHQTCIGTESGSSWRIDLLDNGTKVGSLCALAENDDDPYYSSVDVTLTIQQSFDTYSAVFSSGSSSVTDVVYKGDA